MSIEPQIEQSADQTGWRAERPSAAAEVARELKNRTGTEDKTAGARLLEVQV